MAIKEGPPEMAAPSFFNNALVVDKRLGQIDEIVYNNPGVQAIIGRIVTMDA